MDASRAAAALDDLCDGSESPMESKLRLALVRGGLPEPELDVEVRDDAGLFIARRDQAYRTLRIGVEFDGRRHASDVAQFRRDADRGDRLRDPVGGNRPHPRAE